MRTKKARRLRNKAIRMSKKMGHEPTMVVHTGAMELWACAKRGCRVVMDCWDDPAGHNGPMPHTKCLGTRVPWHNYTNPSDGLVRRTIRKLKKMFSLGRADHV